MFLDWKNQHCKNDGTTTQRNLVSVQALSNYQKKFHRTRTKNFTIYMESQKALNSQSNLEKEMELGKSDSLTSDYTTKLQ